MKRAYEQRIKRCKKACHIRKNKQAKTNKQYTGTEDLLKIFAILIGKHVAVISVNAVFSFNSHRHGSVFRCFPDSLLFWRLTGNNHLTSATNWRPKVTRLMPGKKCINIEGVLRLRLGTPRNRLITLTSLWSFSKKYPLKVYGREYLNVLASAWSFVESLEPVHC